METTLAKNMKAIMKEKKIRNTDLFMRTGVHFSRIGDILRGRTLNPQINTVKRLAVGLGVSIDDLMSEDYQQRAAFAAKKEKQPLRQ